MRAGAFLVRIVSSLCCLAFGFAVHSLVRACATHLKHRHPALQTASELSEELRSFGPFYPKSFSTCPLLSLSSASFSTPPSKRSNPPFKPPRRHTHTSSHN
eukprot:3477307-Rhodomonas_salina.2